jgi:Domain of unknown function (DUF4279)
MILDEDDPTCETTCAMLLVSGDNIEGAEFTHLFGVSPTEVAKAGDCTGWKLSSASKIKSANAEPHIHWILDQISGKENVVAHLKRERNCQVDLGCWWKGRSDIESGPSLTPKTLRRIAGFDLNLIMYFKR